MRPRRKYCNLLPHLDVTCDNAASLSPQQSYGGHVSFIIDEDTLFQRSASHSFATKLLYATRDFQGFKMSPKTSRHCYLWNLICRCNGVTQMRVSEKGAEANFLPVREEVTEKC